MEVSGVGKRAWAIVLGVALAVSFLPLATASATSDRQQRGSIFINSDAGFTPENGIRGGSGTVKDPYVISNWNVSSITIADTDKYVVIRDNTIAGTLRLNWNGDRVKVLKNDIGTLRVNENVKRTGGPTSGRIAHNKIGTVGQLRHWDGVFEENVVGVKDMDPPPFFADRAVNFDGFNGARFRNNKIFGYVDVRLHGHHHGSGFEGGSHDHNLMGAHAGHDMMDHTQRYHQVWLTGNEIDASGSPFALRYLDTAHVANDRTANSEPDPDLEKPHVHYTRVHLNDNVLIGGIEVNTFNARDERHERYERGLVNIKRNSITLTSGTADALESRDGIAIYTAQHIGLTVVGNTVRADHSSDALGGVKRRYGAGIRLSGVEHGDLHLARNSIYDTYYGVHAARMTKTVEWQIVKLRTGGVQQDVYYDGSVENPPQRRS